MIYLVKVNLEMTKLYRSELREKAQEQRSTSIIYEAKKSLDDFIIGKRRATELRTSYGANETKQASWSMNQEVRLELVAKQLREKATPFDENWRLRKEWNLNRTDEMKSLTSTPWLVN